MRPTPLSLRCAVRFRVVFPPPNYFTAAASIFYSSFALLMDPSQSIGYVFEAHEPRRHVDGPQVQVWDLYAYSPFGTEIDLSWQEYGESWTTAAYVTISGGGDLFFADAGVHSLALTGLTPGTNYTITVVGYDLYGAGSDPVSTNLTTIVDSPSDFSAATHSSLGVDLSFSPINGAVSYDLWRTNDYGQAVSAPLTLSPSDLSTDDNGLLHYADSSALPGVAYSYSLTANAASGQQSAPSSPAVATAYHDLTATLAPDSPTVDAGSHATVSFTDINGFYPDTTGSQYTYSYDFNNDGTYEITNSSSPAVNVPAGLTTSPGNLTIAAQVTPVIGGSPQTFTTNLTVATPTLAITGSNSTDEASTYTLNVTPTDPGNNFGYYSINWGDGSNAELFAADGSSPTHTFLNGGNTDSIQATAYDFDGTALATSNSKSVAINNATPSAPLNVTASAFSTTQIQVNWQNTAPDPHGFDILLSTNSGPYTKVATVGPDETSAVLNGLSSGNSYNVAVDAYSGSLTSTASSPTDPTPVSTNPPTWFPVHPDGSGQGVSFSGQLPVTLDAENSSADFTFGGLPVYTTYKATMGAIFFNPDTVNVQCNGKDLF